MTVPTSEPGEPLEPAYADYMLGVLAATLPAGETEAAALARRDAIRIAFQSMRPRNPMEAMLAAEVITAHHVIMNCFGLALRPDVDPAAAARARSSAAALSRVRLATLHALEAQQAPPAALRAAPPKRQKPPAEPMQPVQSAQPAETATQTEASGPAEPAYEQGPVASQRFQPRDRFGKPIPLWRWEYMTMAQRRAAYADPNEVALQQEAIAEEEAAIAEQAALDASEGYAGDGTKVTPQPAEPSQSPSPAGAWA